VVKSGYERNVYQENAGLIYEPTKFRCVAEYTYTPDFCLPNGIYIETKGYFRPGIKAKLLAFTRQYPEHTLFLLFELSNKTASMIAWAEKHGFEYAVGTRVPPAWYLYPHKKENK